MRRAKIEVVKRGSTLRQLVIDALQRELSSSIRTRRRLERARAKLSADAPLRTMSLDEVKRLANAHPAA